jgi:hypothetical protein
MARITGFDLADGSVAYLITDQPSSLLIELRRVGLPPRPRRRVRCSAATPCPAFGHIEQMTEPMNTPVSPPLRQELEQKLKNARCRLVEVGPNYALFHLDRAARPPRINEADDIDGLPPNLRAALLHQSSHSIRIVVHLSAAVLAVKAVFQLPNARIRAVSIREVRDRRYGLTERLPNHLARISHTDE